MIEAFLNQIDFNELATFAGSVVNVVLHGLIIAVIAAIPITITVLIMYAVEKISGRLVKFSAEDIKFLRKIK